MGIQEVDPVHAPVWHEDVRMFEVFDQESGDFIGHFYLGAQGSAPLIFPLFVVSLPGRGSVCVYLTK